MDKTTKKATHISIIGSCVCRDAFSISQRLEEYGSRENEYVVDRFIQGVNPLAAISKPIDKELSASLVEESKESSAPPFYKKCFMLDATKAWENYLSEVKSDYLIIDLTTVRLDCRKIDDGYITYDDIGSTIANGLDNKAPKNATTIFINGESISLSKLSEDELRKIYFEYMDRLLRLYSEDRIIVVCARHARTFVDLTADRIATINHSFDQRYIRDNKLMDFAYSCAKEKLEKAHFIDALPTTVGNVNHKWGQGGLHFVDEAYLYIYRAIDAIIHNQMSIEKERLFLFELREEYAKRIFDKYANIANKCVQESHNILDYSLGMKPGKYESNGVCLTVNSDYSFSICGVANEDTVFYLYQARQNPLDGWRSVQVDTQPARYAFSTKIKNQGENFFIQLVLTDAETNKKWIKGDYTTFVVVEKPYSYRLVRAIIRSGTTVNVEGKLYFEEVK